MGVFGHEIADILATPETQRSERHKSASHWLRRLQATAFEIVCSAGVPDAGSGPVRIGRHDTYLSLDAVDGPAVEILTVTPRPALPVSSPWWAESA